MSTEQEQQTESQWFVLPVQTDEIQEPDGTVEYRERPKYVDEHDGITGFAGTKMRVPSSWGLPFSGMQFVMRLYGTRDALDAIIAEDDSYAEGVDASQEQIADFLNQQYNESKAFEDWTDVFQTGGVS